MTTQQLLYIPNDLRVSLYVLSTGHVVLSVHPSMQVTYEDVPDGISYFIDQKGLILWEKGSKEYEYDFHIAYEYFTEPLLAAWLRQQFKEMP